MDLAVFDIILLEVVIDAKLLDVGLRHGGRTGVGGDGGEAGPQIISSSPWGSIYLRTHMEKLRTRCSRFGVFPSWGSMARFIKARSTPFAEGSCTRLRTTAPGVIKRCTRPLPEYRATVNKSRVTLRPPIALLCADETGISFADSRAV